MTKPSVQFILKNQASLSKDLKNHGLVVYHVIKQIIDNNFIGMENYARQSAPWTDRTGDARRSIASVDDSTKDIIRYWLKIDVDYGIWLEVSNQGKYRILVPTMTIFEAKIIQDLRKIGVEVKATGGVL